MINVIWLRWDERMEVAERVVVGKICKDALYRGVSPWLDDLGMFLICSPCCSCFPS